MLALKIEELEKGGESRTAVVGESKRRKKGSAGKKARRKYRALEEGRAGKKEGKDGEGERGDGKGG